MAPPFGRALCRAAHLTGASQHQPTKQPATHRQSLLTASQLPPMIPVPLAGRMLGLQSRSAGYRAAARGELPTIGMCTQLFVPTELVLQTISLRPAVDAQP
jgi:hypothetical protein